MKFQFNLNLNQMKDVDVCTLHEFMNSSNVNMYIHVDGERCTRTTSSTRLTTPHTRLGIRNEVLVYNTTALKTHAQPHLCPSHGTRAINAAVQRIAQIAFRYSALMHDH